MTTSEILLWADESTTGQTAGESEVWVNKQWPDDPGMAAIYLLVSSKTTKWWQTGDLVPRSHNSHFNVPQLHQQTCLQQEHEVPQRTRRSKHRVPQRTRRSKHRVPQRTRRSKHREHQSHELLKISISWKKRRRSLSGDLTSYILIKRTTSYEGNGDWY